DVRQHAVAAGDLDPEHRVRKRLDDGALHLDRVFLARRLSFCHTTSYPAVAALATEISFPGMRRPSCSPTGKEPRAPRRTRESNPKDSTTTWWRPPMRPDTTSPTVAARGQHLRSVLGDGDGVLEMGRETAVEGHDRPAVGKGLGLPAPDVEHRLDRQRHARG